MPWRKYLPSTKLITIVLALALSAGLVFAADAFTRRPTYNPNVGVDNTTSDTASNWEASLYAIQAANASSTFAAPDPNFVNNLLQAAQSPNVTDTLGRTLLINLSNAKSQGLGDDIPTQDQIIAAAAEQLKAQQASATLYGASDLTIVESTDTSLHTYGNKVMIALNAHPEASERATLLAVDYAVEAGDKTQAANLAKIGAAYIAAGKDLLKIPVPQTLAPLHLQAVNDLIRTGSTFTDMQTISSDPVRGLVALQAYETLMDESSRVFISIAQNLSKGGILFSKDEPGSAWAVFISS